MSDNKSRLNDWFLSLPEERRIALLNGDRWMLADAAFEAGIATHAGVAAAEPAQSDSGDAQGPAQATAAVRSKDDSILHPLAALTSAPAVPEAFTFGMEKVPATCELSLTVALQPMTPGIFAGDLAMFPSPEGKYVRLTDAQSALLAQAAEKDAEIQRLRVACGALQQIIEADDAQVLTQQLIEIGRSALAAIDSARALAKQEKSHEQRSV